MKGSEVMTAYRVQMNKLIVLMLAKGRLIPLTSRVWMTSGMKLRGITCVRTLDNVPKVPQSDIESRSKLNI